MNGNNIALLIIGSVFGFIISTLGIIFWGFTRFESLTMMLLYVILFNQVMKILNLWETEK